MIYLLHGENTFASSQQMNGLLKGEYSLIDGSVLDSIDPIFQQSDSISMFAGLTQKKTLVKRFFSNRKKTLQEKLLTELETRTELPEIIFWESGKVDARLKLYKYISKHGKVVESTILNESNVINWLVKYADEKDVNLSSSIARTIVNHVGTNQHILAGEVNKLILLAKSHERNFLVEEDISILAGSTLEASRWDLLEAINSGNKKLSLQLVNQILQNPNEFQPLVGLLAWQFRTLYLVSRKDLTTENLAELGIKGYVLQKARSYLHKTNSQKILVLHHKLANLDLAVKEGRIDARIGINMLLTI